MRQLAMSDSRLMYSFSLSRQRLHYRLWHNDHAYAARLTDHAPRNALETQPTQPRLRMLDLGNLVDVLQADGADGALDRLARPRRDRPEHRRLALPGRQIL